MENLILIDLIIAGIGALLFVWCARIKNMIISILLTMVGFAALCGGLVGLVVHIGRLWWLL